MRKIGDIMVVKFGNEHDGKKCIITGITRRDGADWFNIELLDKQFNWRTGHDDLTFRFSDVHYCHLKDS